MKLTPKDLVNTVQDLKSDRGTWESSWQEIVDLVIPRKNQITRKNHPGQKRNTLLFDTTAQQANVLLSGALSSLLVNPQLPWFRLTTGDEEIDQQDDVRAYFQKVERKMLSTLNNTNFYPETGEMFTDLTSIGTGALSINEDDVEVVRFASHHISEFYIRENSKKRVDEFYRRFEWNALQIQSEFGEKALMKHGAKTILKALKEKDFKKKFWVVNGIYPDDRGGGVSTTFKWLSQWVIEVDFAEVKLKGFNELPVVVPRWTRGTGEMYARSPASVGLPDIKMINLMEKAAIQGAQKTVDPPLQAPDDGVLRPLRTQPGGISYYRAGTSDRIEPVFNNFRPDFSEAVLEKTRARIKQAFFVDQLQLPEIDRMTATEVSTRRDQSMVLLGPILARLNFEFLRPLIDRMFGIMDRRGMLPEPPAVLDGLNVDAQFTSLIARVQQEQEITNFRRFFESMTFVAQVKPESLDNIDTDQMTLVLAKRHGLPQEVIVDEDDRDEKREEREDQTEVENEQVQNAEDAQNASKLASVVKLNQ